ELNIYLTTVAGGAEERTLATDEQEIGLITKVRRLA
ncbi:unnamed protein product, partial [marine sediment metagenome]